MELKTNTIERFVFLIKGLYLLMACFVLIGFFVIFAFSGNVRVEGLISGFTSFILFFGLHRKLPWAPSVIVYLAGFGLFSLLITYTPSNFVALFAKVLFTSFLIFEIYFFTRKDVRVFFKVKNIFLFSR